ncbi:hypothetical protein ABVJ08_002002 [Salmonella enterica subsp. enterica serovar Bredeney]|nr:hypothetical protein [Salmonella enterica subsp. enterica serovar Kentucky]EBW4855635.1 hypothetical protein [Salmonella enterica subsp. enterica serovar Kentucky]
MKELQLRKRTTLIPLKELKQCPVFYSPKDHLDLSKEKKVIISAFREVINLRYFAAPMDCAIEHAMLDGRTSLTVYDLLEEKNIGIETGILRVNKNELLESQKQLMAGVQLLLEQYGFYSEKPTSAVSTQPIICDHGFEVEWKTIRGQDFILIHWFAPYLWKERTTVYALLEFAVYWSIYKKERAAAMKTVMTTPLNQLFTSGLETDFNELCTTIFKMEYGYAPVGYNR